MNLQTIIDISHKGGVGMEFLASILEQAASWHPTKPFLVYHSTPVTYQEFSLKTHVFACELEARGIARGMRVGLCMNSTPSLAIAYYACLRIGAVAVPINPGFRVKEVREIANRTGLSLLVLDRGYPPTLARELAASLPDSGTVLSVDAGGCIVQEGNNLEPRKTPDSRSPLQLLPSDPAVIFFGSGTTGAPKGAIQTYANLYFAARDSAVHCKFRFAQEVILCAAPLFTNFGHNPAMNLALYNMGTMILLDKWDADMALKQVSRWNVTYMLVTPTMLIQMLEHFDRSCHNLSSLRLVVTAGAPVAPDIIRNFETNTGIRAICAYGSTETTSFVTAEPLDGAFLQGSCGAPIGSSSVVILNDEGDELPAGAIGEIVVTGDTISPGYWNDKENDRRYFQSSAWFSGDLGYIDEHGHLYVVDRKKDIIINSGFNVYPYEIESVLITHPAVELAAAFAEPDKVEGEVPVACVQLRSGMSADTDNLVEYCQHYLADYKVPRRVYVVSALPLGPTGKVLRRMLRTEVGLVGGIRGIEH